jgi:hypothetical protein
VQALRFACDKLWIGAHFTGAAAVTFFGAAVWQPLSEKIMPIKNMALEILYFINQPDSLNNYPQ